MGAYSSFIDSALHWCLYLSRHHKLHGVIQKTLRNHLDITPNPAYFDIMNIPGAIFIYTLFYIRTFI